MKTCTILVLLGALACYGAENPQEEPAEFSASVETTLVSSYLWRGYVLNDSPSLQPAVTIGYKGLSVSAWSNFSKTVPNSQAWTETDLTIEYTRNIGKWALTGAFLDYRYPDLSDNRRSEEVSFGVAYETLLNPSFRYYRDIELGKGGYFFAGVEHGFALPFSKGLTANIGGGVGLNHHQYQAQTTISDVDLNVSVDVPAGRGLTISPFITCMAGHRTLFGKHAAFGVKFAMGE